MSEEQIKDMILKQCLELTTNNDFRPPISAYDGVDIDDVVRTCKQLQDKKTYLDLVKENKKLNGAIQTYDILLKSNVEENKQLKDLIDTILNFSFLKEECPLNFSFEDNSKEDEAQNIFYNDEYCENNCNDIYKDCWLKYFKKLQELEGSDSNV